MKWAWWAAYRKLLMRSHGGFRSNCYHCQRDTYGLVRK